jgi:hypothetical protein
MIWSRLSQDLFIPLPPLMRFASLGNLANKLYPLVCAAPPLPRNNAGGSRSHSPPASDQNGSERIRQSNFRRVHPPIVTRTETMAKDTGWSFLDEEVWQCCAQRVMA